MSGERWVNGGDLDAVAELLQIAPTGHRMMAPEELIRRYDRILAETQRYLARFPQEHMSMTVPRRERRDMRELGYHVFAIAEDLMKAKDGDEYTQGNRPVPSSTQTFSDIVDYGSEIRERLKAWFAERDAAAWGKKLSTSYGDFPLHLYLERATWHSGQHLRQVVEMERLAGVRDVEPLPSDLFDGLPIPDRLWE